MNHSQTGKNCPGNIQQIAARMSQGSQWKALQNPLTDKGHMSIQKIHKTEDGGCQMGDFQRDKELETFPTSMNLVN